MAKKVQGRKILQKLDVNNSGIEARDVCVKAQYTMNVKNMS